MLDSSEYNTVVSLCSPVLGSTLKLELELIAVSVKIKVYIDAEGKYVNVQVLNSYKVKDVISKIMGMENLSSANLLMIMMSGEDRIELDKEEVFLNIVDVDELRNDKCELVVEKMDE